MGAKIRSLRKLGPIRLSPNFVENLIKKQSMNSGLLPKKFLEERLMKREKLNTCDVGKVFKRNL